MAFKAIYDTEDDIPEELRPLNIYALNAKSKKYELTGFEGIKTSADVARVQEGATKERTEHDKTKARFRPWIEFSPEQITEMQEKLDGYDELKLRAESAGDPKKIEDLVNARINTMISPVQRAKEKAEKDLADAQKRIGDFEGEKRTRTIHDAVRAAATESKILGEATDDVLLNAERVFEVAEDGETVRIKDKIGLTPGLSPGEWLSEMQPKRPHWWPGSKGAGANGGRGDNGGLETNPWSAEHWNITQQSAYYKTAGPEKAATAAKAAGTVLFGPKPAPKQKAA